MHKCSILANEGRHLNYAPCIADIKNKYSLLLDYNLNNPKKQFILNVKASFWHLIQKHYHQLHKNWTHDNNPCENREISILTISKARTSLKAFPWGERKTSRYKDYRQEKETIWKGWTKLKKHKLVWKKVSLSLVQGPSCTIAICMSQLPPDFSSAAYSSIGQCNH
jgi:hypothetical protein